MGQMILLAMVASYKKITQKSAESPSSDKSKQITTIATLQDKRKATKYQQESPWAPTNRKKETLVLCIGLSTVAQTPPPLDKPKF